MTNKRIGRPKTDQRMVPVIISLPPSILAAVDQIAASGFETRAGTLRRMIVAAIRDPLFPRTEGERELVRRFAEMKKRVFAPDRDEFEGPA